MNGATERAGEIVAGRFCIERFRGAGAFGTVYRASDRSTGQVVALKMMAAADPSGHFEAEAELLARLEHEAIVRYVAHGIHGAERYLATEFLDGPTLDERLTLGTPTLEEVHALARRVASGLAAAHAAGVVHRDLKPGNLLLTGGRLDEVRILDFGIALLVRAPAQTGRRSTLVGTPGYLAPEQARGADHVDARADVFSLGCVLFEALTGRTAFAAPHLMAMLAKIVFEDVPRVDALAPAVPAPVADLIERMLAKDAAERPANGAALLEQIALAFAGTASRERPESSLLLREQRLLSVLFAEGPVERAEVMRLAAEHAGRGLTLEMLEDGTIVGLVRLGGAATDLVDAAAECAAGLWALLRRTVVVVTGRADLRHGAPSGEAIERASELLRARHCAAIVVDDTTASLASASWDVTRHGTWNELGPRSSDGMVRADAPMVGRDRELAMLSALVEESVEDQTPVVALVTAEAGMGKTRLRRELALRVAGWREPPLVHVARAERVGAGSSWALVRRLLRSALGSAAEQLRAQIASEHADPDGFLAELAGVADAEPSVALRSARRDPVLMTEQLGTAWCGWLRRELERAPVLLLLEDLHWGDAPSVRLIDHALTELHQAPLTVVAFGRPELEERFEGLFARHRPNRVRLSPLSRVASERLVQSMLGDRVSGEARDRLIERAGGNAFYLEELARAVAEGRADRLPGSVLAMAQARLEALAPEERQLLRAASVLGRAFTSNALACLFGGADHEGVERRLRRLVEAELLELRGEAYRFRHDLVQEAAYATFTERDRARAHGVAAEELLVGGEADALVVAQHLEAAGRAADAAPHWLAAAEGALAAHDVDEALARAERAARAASNEALRGACLALLAEVHRWRGEHELAARSGEDAAALLAPGGASWFRASREALTAHGRAGRYEGVVVWSERVLDQSAAEGASTERLLALCAAGRQLFHAGRYDLAERVRSEAAHVGVGALEPTIAAQVYGLEAAAARHRGDLVGDLNGYRRVLEACERAGDRRNASNARVSVGFAHASLGDHERAAKELRRALESAEALGLAAIATRARQNLGLVCGHAGDFGEAVRLLDRVIEESRAQGNARFEGWTTVYRAQVAYAAGRIVEAESMGRRAMALLAVSPPAQAGALAITARALIALGCADEARALSGDAMTVLHELGAIEEFESLVRLADAEARGTVEAANDALARLRERAAAIPDQTWRARFLRNVPENRAIIELARGMEAQ